MGAGGTIRGGGQSVARPVEDVGDRIADGEKPLHPAA